MNRNVLSDISSTCWAKSEKITSKTFYNTYKRLSSIMITRRNKLYLIGFGIVGIIFIVRFLS